MTKTSLRQLSSARQYRNLDKRIELGNDQYNRVLRKAHDLAKKDLQPGDTLTIMRCAGIISTVTFMAAAANTLCSKTLDDIHAVHILKHNGEIVDYFAQALES